MVRNTETITVSVPKEMAEQIDQLDLSPSKVLQEAIQKAIDHNKGKMELIKANEYLREGIGRTHQILAEFMEHKGIDFKEYNDFVFSWNKRREKNGAS